MKRKLALATAMVMLALVAGSGYVALQGSGGDQGSDLPGSVSLVRPAIAQTGSFLDTEAGMSAYTDTGLSINLSSARSAFRTVERETSDWIVGSVPVPGYGEEEDAHVFVHREGWIVAYYERGSPVGRTVHWTGHPTVGVNKLQQVLTQVAGSAGVPVVSPGFYNFEFPNATEWLLIIDDDSFSVNIPSEILVFERSYSFFVTVHSSSPCDRSQDRSYLIIDGTTLTSQCTNDTFYDSILATQLSSDARHEINASSESDETLSSVAISLLYIP